MNKILKHPVISAIVASLIISFLTWLARFSTSALQWLGDMTKSTYLFITQDISLPLWLLIAILIPLIKSAYELIRSHTRKDIALTHVRTDTDYTSINLTDDEQRIMKIFIEADGKPLKASHIKYTTRMPSLRIEQIIEVLEEKDLIEIHSNYIDGESLWLTRLGRDFMIGNAYTAHKK